MSLLSLPSLSPSFLFLFSMFCPFEKEKAKRRKRERYIALSYFLCLALLFLWLNERKQGDISLGPLGLISFSFISRLLLSFPNFPCYAQEKEREVRGRASERYEKDMGKRREIQENCLG